MRRVLCLLLATVVALALPAASCGGEEQTAPPEVAAVVDGREILAVEVDALTDRYLAAPATSGRTGSTIPPLERPVALRFVLNYLIRLTMLEVVAGEFDLEVEIDPELEMALESVSPEDFARSNVTADDLRVAERAGDISRRVAVALFPEVAVAEDEVRRIYEQESYRYESGWSATVHTAFLGSLAAAEQLRSATQQGASFLGTAETLGALESGSMGVVTSTSPLPPDILEAIGSLAPGEVSEAIQASIGWLLFFVETREAIGETPYDVARLEILAVLADQERQRLFDDWFQQRVTEADVEVDEFYGRWNAQSGTVRSSRQGGDDRDDRDQDDGPDRVPA
ncbi:MAG: peptidyl-prolyl cis-trans isomerase [bacterium]|nr:peptidyl-prolyl cis-trans isomerase [bacterium]